MRINLTKPRQAGVSLFELLMTLAILGVMGSIALAAFGDESSAINDTRDRRNAQELAAVSSAAHAAGLDFIVTNETEATVRKIIAGAAPSSGAFKGRVFKVNFISQADIAGAVRFLRIEHGELLYRHDS